MCWKLFEDILWCYLWFWKPKVCAQNLSNCLLMLYALHIRSFWFVNIEVKSQSLEYKQRFSLLKIPTCWICSKILICTSTFLPLLVYNPIKQICIMAPQRLLWFVLNKACTAAFHSFFDVLQHIGHSPQGDGSWVHLKAKGYMSFSNLFNCRWWRKCFGYHFFRSPLKGPESFFLCQQIDHFICLQCLSSSCFMLSS